MYTSEHFKLSCTALQWCADLTNAPGAPAALTCLRADINHVDQALYTSYPFSEGGLIHVQPPICAGLMPTWLQDVDAVKGWQKLICTPQAFKNLHWNCCGLSWHHWACSSWVNILELSNWKTVLLTWVRQHDPATECYHKAAAAMYYLLQQRETKRTLPNAAKNQPCLSYLQDSRILPDTPNKVLVRHL